MEIKGSRQLYNKLFYIYTAILACVILSLVVYFFTSTRRRFLEQNLSYTEMMGESAAAYMEETADIAEYIHEDLYKSAMELPALYDGRALRLSAIPAGHLHGK